MRTFTTFITMLFAAIFSTHATEPLEIGASIPNLTVKDHAGAEINLPTMASKGWLLVFFYPKADTPGCTAQACSLRDSFEALKGKGIQVIGVSADSASAQASFQTKHTLPYPLIPDPERTLIDAFGVPKILGMASRQAYLFQNGKLVWRDLKGSTKNQADDILKAFGELTVPAADTAAPQPTSSAPNPSNG